MKHGLVLSGGGAKGAWEAGAAVALVEHYAKTDSPITHFSGASVGGLNAAALVGKGARSLMEVWSTIRGKDVFRGSHALAWWRAWRTGAIYDSSPLREYVEENLDLAAIHSSDLRLYVHATLMGTKQSVVFQNEDPDLVTGVYGGASVPPFFPPVPWKGRWLLDGGVVDNSPIRALIQAGCEKVSIISLDHELPASPVEARSVLRLLKPQPRPGLVVVVAASVDGMMDAHFWRDLKNVQLINELVMRGGADPQYRRVEYEVFRPKESLGGTLDFDHDHLLKMMDDGYHSTLRSLVRRG